MTDIVEFLTARMDEDEAAAVRAARPEPWIKPQPSRPNWYVQFWADQQDRAAVIADPESSAYPIVTTLGYDGNDEADEELAEGRVEHIARHDPARVLREVAAKRAILKLHEPQLDRVQWRRDETCYQCSRCTGGGREYDQVGGVMLTELSVWPCLTVMQLAAPYADHPDYDPAWRVE